MTRVDNCTQCTGKCLTRYHYYWGESLKFSLNGMILKIVFLPQIAIFLYVFMAGQTVAMQHHIWHHIIKTLELQCVILLRKFFLKADISQIYSKVMSKKSWAELNKLLLFIILFSYGTNQQLNWAENAGEINVKCLYYNQNCLYYCKTIVESQ